MSAFPWELKPSGSYACQWPDTVIMTRHLPCLNVQHTTTQLQSTRGTMRAYSFYNTDSSSARVQYVLGTEFALPRDALNHLLQSCCLYAAALERAPVQSNNVPSAARLDVLSNWGYALQALGDIVEEFGWLDYDVRGSELVNLILGTAEAHADQLYLAAVKMFDEVAAGQMAVLQGAAAMKAPDDEDQNEQRLFPSGTGQSADSEPTAAAYTASLVAPSSLLETLNDALTCYTGLILHASVLEPTLFAVENIWHRAETYLTSLPPGFGATQSPPHAWEEQCTALADARLNIRVAAAQRTQELDGPFAAKDLLAALRSDILEASAILLASPPPPQSLTAVRLSDEIQAQHELSVARLCDLGDSAHTLARLYVQRISHGDGHEAAAAAWDLGSCASRCFLTAVAALEPSHKPAISSASTLALTGAPMAWIRMSDAPHIPHAINTSTSISRSRASIYASLSAIALTRADKALMLHPPAAESNLKLFDHARVYARRALNDGGLAWVLHVRPAPTDGDVWIYGRALAHAPPDGGWESAARDTTLLLGATRALWLRTMHRTQTDIGSDAELNALVGATWSLLHSNPQLWRDLLDPSASVSRFMEDVATPQPEEQEFWLHHWIPAMSAPHWPAQN